MPPSIRQTNFTGGELDPLLWGRTDSPLFGKGARGIRNFFVAKSGAAVSRPGSRFVAMAKNGVTNVMLNGWDSGRVRLIPFIAGDSSAFVLELGNQYMRFHTLGHQVLEANAAKELVTPWSWGALEQLRYAQVGDVMTLVHPNAPPQELKYTGATGWTLAPIDFARPAARFPIIDDPAIALSYGFCLDLMTLGAADATHPAQEWQWTVTAMLRDKTTGETIESAPQLVTESIDSNDYDATHAPLASNMWAIYPDRPQTLLYLPPNTLPPPAQPADFAKYDTIGFNIYRGRGGLFGFVGTTTENTFVDTGLTPDYSLQPPQGRNPFAFAIDVTEGNPAQGVQVHYTEAQERPAAVAFFQTRRAFAGSGIAYGSKPESNTFSLKTGRQGRLWFSATDDFTDFDTHDVVDVHGEALEFELAALTRQQNRHLVTINKLVVLTDSAAWVGAGDNGPLDFDDVDFQLTDHVGATHVTPVLIDGTILFIRTKGSGARALVPQDQFTPYQGVDISEHSRHLFVGAKRTVIDWTYAEDPWGIVWAVRDDGALLSLTYSRQLQMAAWARHDTDGIVESVCSIPEGEEDAVYIVVQRQGNGAAYRSIERLTSRVRRVLEADPSPTFIRNIQDVTPADTDSLYPTDVCVDSAFTFVGNPAEEMSGADFTRFVGKDVYVVARGSPVLGPYPVRLNPITGFGQFDITEFADQLPNPNAVDNAGVPVWVAHIGLLFTPELETLDAAPNDRLRKKTVARVGFEVDNSRGLSVGQDFDHLKRWRQRQVNNGWDPISAATELVDTPVASNWDQSARAVLRQTLPLPVTVVGITRELAVEEAS